VEVIRQGQLWFLNNMLFDDYKALFNAVTSVGNGPNQLELLMRTPFTSQEIWKEKTLVLLKFEVGRIREGTEWNLILILKSSLETKAKNSKIIILGTKIRTKTFTKTFQSARDNKF
jgi:hypothetical protein